MPATRCPASSRSRTSCSPSRGRSGVLLAGLEHLDDRYLRAVGYSTKSKRGGAAEDGAGRRHRRRQRRRRGARHLRGRAHRQLAQRRGLRRHQPRGAQEVLAGPQAHGGDQQAHQRLQDQRGRGDPAAAHGRIHRRHRAHQHRAVAGQQDQAGRRARGVLRPRQPAAGQAGRRRRDPLGRAAGRPRGAGAGAGARGARAVARLAARTSRRCSRSCRTTRCARAGRRRSARRCRTSLPGRRSGRSWTRPTPSTSACSRAASGWRCTCTPATATCTPTSRSTATTTRCCRPRTAP